jgi:hypothetical protein
MLSQQNRFEAKMPEDLNGGRVLGLRVFRDNNVLCWKRDNHFAAPEETMTKRNIFSLCGQLVGHFPVAGWLRPACSFFKRSVNNKKWDEVVDEVTMKMIHGMVGRVSKQDPVRGRWAVTKHKKGRIWCDASSLAIGICLEIDGCIAEDNSWLRPLRDVTHINLAELEAAIKGMNLALKWGLQEIDLVMIQPRVQLAADSTHERSPCEESWIRRSSRAQKACHVQEHCFGI